MQTSQTQTCACVSICVPDSHHGTDAAATHGGLELAVHLFYCAGRVKALSQQDDTIQEEERGNAVDDVLQNLNTG